MATSFWLQNIKDEFTIIEEYGEPLYKYRPNNITELFRNTESKFPDKLAFVYGNERLTYREFGRRVNNVAGNMSKKFGVKKGDRVAFLLGNGLEYPICFFAVAQIGAVSIPLNTRLAGKEIEHEIMNSGAVILIMDNEFTDRVESVLPQLDLKHVFVVDSQGINRSLPFSELTGEAGDIVFEDVDESNICSIMYTSGTTGTPKGAMLTHKGFVATAMNLANVYGLVTEDITLFCVPFIHVTGMLQFLGAVYSGMTIVIVRSFKTNQAIELVARERVTFMVGVPTMYWFLLVSPEFDRNKFRTVREILYGGAPAPVDLIKLLRKEMPNARIHNGYGLTESHALDTLLPDGDALRKPESIGPPVPLVRVKIVDENDTEVKPNQVGELCLKGPKVIPGYWGNPEASRAAIIDGWLHTGDLARVDEEGYVYIVDRKKDIINRGGEKIYSIEVENVLYSHPAVLEAAVVGVHDKYFGEQVKAVVVLKPGQIATEEEIKEFCAGKLADYKVPKFIEFRDLLPRNPGGKVIKQLLK